MNSSLCATWADSNLLGGYLWTGLWCLIRGHEEAWNYQISQTRVGVKAAVLRKAIAKSPLQKQSSFRHSKAPLKPPPLLLKKFWEISKGTNPNENTRTDLK